MVQISEHVMAGIQAGTPLLARPTAATAATPPPAARWCSVRGNASNIDDDDEEEEDVVLSEVHMECWRPAAAGTPSISVFTAGGGDELARIHHSLATPLSRVGLQVWRGSLLLADYILQQGSASSLGGCVALELGAGPGVAGLVMARLARIVFLTDVGAEVLANAQLNASQRATATAATHVRQLDWLDPPDWLLPAQPPGSSNTAVQVPASLGEAGASSYEWRESDLSELQRLDVLLAADCVYDDVLTEAFMRCAVLLMQYTRRHSGHTPRLLVGLERRVVFTMVEMVARAPAYDHWRSLFREIEGPLAAAAAAARGAAAVWGGGIPAGGAAAAPELPFSLVGWRLDAGRIPQAVQEYARSEYMELWELALTDG